MCHRRIEPFALPAGDLAACDRVATGRRAKTTCRSGISKPFERAEAKKAETRIKDVGARVIANLRSLSKAGVSYDPREGGRSSGPSELVASSLPPATLALLYCPSRTRCHQKLPTRRRAIRLGVLSPPSDARLFAS